MYFFLSLERLRFLYEIRVVGRELVLDSMFEEVESFWDNYFSCYRRGSYEVSYKKGVFLLGRILWFYL